MVVVQGVCAVFLSPPLIHGLNLVPEHLLGFSALESRTLGLGHAALLGGYNLLIGDLAILQDLGGSSIVDLIRFFGIHIVEDYPFPIIRERMVVRQAPRRSLFLFYQGRWLRLLGFNFLALLA